jgi:GcrA cell cycle regulator
MSLAVLDNFDRDLARPGDVRESPKPRPFVAAPVGAGPESAARRKTGKPKTARFDWDGASTATLRKLWRAGKSATFVAVELGFPCTRNAVIGKIHRLGIKRDEREARHVVRHAAPAKLSLDVSPQRARTLPRPKLELEAVAKAAPDLGVHGSFRPAHEPVSLSRLRWLEGESGAEDGRAADSQVPLSRAHPPAKVGETLTLRSGGDAPPHPDHPLPASRPIALFEMEKLHDAGSARCHWPLGDPLTPEFRFCGALRGAGDKVYCGPHRTLATSPKGRPQGTSVHRPDEGEGDDVADAAHPNITDAKEDAPLLHDDEAEAA